MGIGAGELRFVLIATFVILIILLVFPRLEIWIDHIRESRTYRIAVATVNVQGIEEIQSALRACDLPVYQHHQSKIGPTIVGTWQTIGSPRNHDRFVTEMLRNTNVEEFVY
jgi:putative Mg2+ transporter-C (MgtC) family protein